MTIFNIFKVIKEGTKAVPATKYAIGVAGLVAIVALISSFKIDLRIALWGTIILFGLMILLVVFAKLTKTAAVEFKTPVKVLMWTFVFLFITISVLLTSSVFFKFPVDLQFVLIDNSTSKDTAATLPKNDSSTSQVAAPSYKNAFNVNYMRLFGAFEVPEIMKIMEAQGNIMPSREYPGDYHIRNTGTYINSNLANFWKEKWEYKDALPIRTMLWNEYSGDNYKGQSLYWSSLSKSPQDLWTYRESNFNEREAYVGDYVSYEDVIKETGIIPPKNWPFIEHTGIKTTDIGYFFLILTNKTDREISDIEIIFNQYHNDLKIEKQNFKTFKKRKDPRSIAVNDSTLMKLTPIVDTIKMASLKPDKSFIWLLACYKKKRNSLPDFYLTDITIPKKIKFISNSGQYFDTIRMPYGEKAIRLDVPAGWYSQ